MSDITPGISCLIAGWGTNNRSGELTEKLQEGGVNIMSDSYCLAHAKDRYRRVVTGRRNILGTKDSILG